MTLWAADLRSGPPPSPPSAGFEVCEVLPPGTEVAAAMGAEGDLVAARLARGCRCFAACRDGAVAAYGWFSAGPEWIGEVGVEVRPAPGEAYVWNCVTLPEWRLRGAFRSVLLGVVAAARAEGVSRLWIGSAEVGAVSAVVGAGFTPVLTVVNRSLGGVRIVTTRPAPGASPDLVDAARRSLRAPAVGLRRRRRH